uniref:Uncharacterized protein n=1 Tax=Anguilla anguilla TaxID=7936 RepID=A0A0E9TEX5_ANGAN
MTPIPKTFLFLFLFICLYFFFVEKFNIHNKRVYIPV